MSDWHNVSKKEPCPICHKTDWCNLSNDGAVCICHRVESPHLARSGSGWIHRLINRPFAPYRPRPRGQALVSGSRSAVPVDATLAFSDCGGMRPSRSDRVARGEAELAKQVARGRGASQLNAKFQDAPSLATSENAKSACREDAPAPKASGNPRATARAPKGSQEVALQRSLRSLVYNLTSKFAKAEFFC